MAILLTIVVVAALWLLFRYQFRLMRRLYGLQREALGVQAELLRRDILRDARYADERRLNRFEGKVFSQNGEDGVLAEIFARIGTTNRYFVEFGCGTGEENNTVNLLRQGWSGLWMDGSSKAMAKVRRAFARELKEGRLKARAAWIKAENIEQLLEEEGTPEEPDLVSIDIDGNDYWVWRAIRGYRPRVVVIEYNGWFPPSQAWVTPYEGEARRKGGGWNGASLKALEELGREKGYDLVGCVLAGVNAFFVRSDVSAGKFAAPFTAENHYEPARLALHAGERRGRW